MGKKNYKPEEHGYMPLPPVDDGGEPIIPFGMDEQINLRDKFAPWESKATEAEPVAAAEAESAEMPEVANEEPVVVPAVEPEAPSVELEAPVASGSSESFGTKVAALGLAAKARAGAAVDKIRQNPAAAIAGFAGAAVVIALIVLTFVWTRSAGENVQPDMIADDNEQQEQPGFPDGDNQAEVEPTYVSDLLCSMDKKTDAIYGFKGFENMAVVRRITFTPQNTPNELFVTNIFTFSGELLTNKLKFDAKTVEYKTLFDAKYPERERGFSIKWTNAKASGIQMDLSTRLRNTALTDEQLLQFGLQPKTNADGTLVDGYYSREEIEKRWKAEGFKCSVDKDSENVASK
jgi:hypothetical protein